jgi:hypothetical protein
MMRARVFAIALIMLVFSAISLVHCTPTDVVVADLSELQNDGGEVIGGSCINNTDCSADSYCKLDNCAALSGTCTARPTICDDSPATVCGCDGVNYWNDCLRAFSGTSAVMVDGECPHPVGCGGHEKRACPVSNAFCAHLVHDANQCANPSGPMDLGFCWVLPPTCPVDIGQQWASCALGPDGGPPDCVATCDAIRSEAPHQPVLSCPPGP